jgi:hypothetical protein
MHRHGDAVAEEADRRSWWRRLRRPKPNLKIDELEAKLRKAERERDEKQRRRDRTTGNQ